MIEHQLIINARFRPEVIERILRIVRHRGFLICSIHMDEPTQSEQLTLKLTVTSERPIQLLYTQLSKLMDVEDVNVQFESPKITAVQA